MTRDIRVAVLGGGSWGDDHCLAGRGAHGDRALGPPRVHG